ERGPAVEASAGADVVAAAVDREGGAVNLGETGNAIADEDPVAAAEGEAAAVERVVELGGERGDGFPIGVVGQGVDVEDGARAVVGVVVEAPGGPAGAVEAGRADDAGVGGVGVGGSVGARVSVGGGVGAGVGVVGRVRTCICICICVCVCPRV